MKEAKQHAQPNLMPNSRDNLGSLSHDDFVLTILYYIDGYK